MTQNMIADLIDLEKIDDIPKKVSRKRKEVEVETSMNFIHFKHHCGNDCQIKLRATEPVLGSEGRFKQYVEIKCWACKLPFKTWKKNCFGKHGNEKKKNVKRVKKIIEIEDENEN